MQIFVISTGQWLECFAVLGCMEMNLNLCMHILTLLPSFADLSSAQRKFAESLNEFKFQCIGDAETDDEMCIGERLPYCLSNMFWSDHDRIIMRFYMLIFFPTIELSSSGYSISLYSKCGPSECWKWLLLQIASWKKWSRLHQEIKWHSCKKHFVVNLKPWLLPHH